MGKTGAAWGLTTQGRRKKKTVKETCERSDLKDQLKDGERGIGLCGVVGELLTRKKRGTAVR